MKISAVSNSNINNANKSKNPSFKGLTNGLVNFWHFVDTGGRAVQFTVEDMCGTNLPRTYKGAMAGYKYTGRINYAALAQEALREFLTGPTMCLTPFAIISLAKRFLGKTSNTHIENITNLSYIMDSIKGTSKENLDNNFIHAVAEDMIRQTTGVEEVSKTDVEDLSSRILAYKKHCDQRMLSNTELQEMNLIRPSKNELKEELAQIGTNFEKIVKKNKPSYEDTSFLLAKYSISDNAAGAFKTVNYVDYAVNYANDFKKTFKEGVTKVTSETVQSFKNGWLGKRLGIIAAMIGLTGLAMSTIPKIYTKASGNVNPNAKEIYNEADKLPTNKRREVKA